MNFRYACALAALIGMIICGGGVRFLLAMQKDTNTFVLCTNSSDTTIDCALFSVQQNNKPILLFSSSLDNKDVSNFTDVICDVMERIKNDQGITVEHACFSVPGVASADGTYWKFWRLPYVIDTKDIMQRSGLKTATIVNNFLAMSYGIDCVDDIKITSLYDVPAEVHGRRAIIGAGGGLGSVSMVWNEAKKSY